MIKLNFIKDRLAAEKLSEHTPTGRVAESRPEIQRLPADLTPAQREQAENIKYFFKSWCGHAAWKP